jgi:hypothetical protein
VTVEPRLSVTVKFFGRHRSGALRDGVLLLSQIAAGAFSCSPSVAKG